MAAKHYNISTTFYGDDVLSSSRGESESYAWGGSAPPPWEESIHSLDPGIRSVLRPVFADLHEVLATHHTRLTEAHRKWTLAEINTIFNEFLD